MDTLDDQHLEEADAIDYGQGPRFDLGPEIEEDLERMERERVELIARGVPPEDVFFLLLCMLDSCTTPSMIKWCYSSEQITTTYMSMKRYRGWFKAYVLDGRDHQHILQLVNVETIGKPGFQAHLQVPQLRAGMQSWLSSPSCTAAAAAPRSP